MPGSRPARTTEAGRYQKRLKAPFTQVLVESPLVDELINERRDQFSIEDEGQESQKTQSTPSRGRSPRG
jgi:hypothetical protein